MAWTILYIAAILGVNYGFSVTAPIEVFGVFLPPMTFVVGAIFVIRDFAQRQIGHWVWLAMGVGVLLSYLMADPFVATASAAAFLVSEAADWAVYTFTKMPFHQRILLSSVVSTPVDSTVFLVMIGFASIPAIALMTASKMVVAVAVWWWERRQVTQNG